LIIVADKLPCTVQQHALNQLKLHFINLVECKYVT